MSEEKTPAAASSKARFEARSRTAGGFKVRGADDEEARAQAVIQKKPLVGLRPPP